MSKWFLVMAIVCASCSPGMQSPGKGGSGGFGGIGGSGGGAGGSGGGSGGSGGVGGSGGGSGGSGGGQALGGGVDAWSWSSTASGSGYGAGAGFGAAGGCTNMTYGPCETFNCPTQTMNPHAGTITISGGAQTVTLTPGTDGSYAEAMGTTALWHGGETIMFSAAGNPNGIGAFSGSVQAPGPVTVTTLGAAAWPTQALTVSRSQALTVGWMATSAPAVIVNVDTATAGISCLFDGSAGSGTIPVEALQALGAGMGDVSVSTSDGTDVMAGSAMISLSVSTLGITSAGDIADAQVTLQ